MRFLIDADFRLVTKVAEPQAWKIEYRYGYNCFDLARWMLTAGVLSLNAGWASIHPAMLRALGPMSGFFWFVIMASFSAVEFATVTRPHFLNPMKPHWYIRIGMSVVYMFLIVSGLQIGNFISSVCDIIGSALIISAFYLSACNVMPAKWEPPVKEHVPAGAFQGA